MSTIGVTTALAVAKSDDMRRQVRSHGRGDRIFNTVLALSAGLVPLIMVLFLGVLLYGAWPAFHALGFSIFTSTNWDPSDSSKNFGGLAFLYGTIATSVLALLIAGPVGIAVAAFLHEILERRTRGVIVFLIETLATIPSVVYGMWGLFVLKPFVTNVIQPHLKPLQPVLDRIFHGHFPLFNGPPIGVGMLTGTLILIIMILPIIVSISLEAIRAVPNVYREAALGLGATRWEMIRVAVLPVARPGLFGGCILALGRALGETMAITMVIGNTAQMKWSLFEPADTISSVIANQYPEASGLQFAALTELALILLILTLAVNLLARLIIRRMDRVTGGGS
jgi:phosphate transport system permease protein